MSITKPKIMDCLNWRSSYLWIDRRYQQGCRLLLLPLLALLLTGCIDYDLGIRFHSPSSGEIVQQLRVSERLRSLSDATLQQWTDAIGQRTQQVGGQVNRQPDQTLLVRIPFSDAKDLETKFNQFFNPDQALLAESAFPPITSHLSLQRNNFILVERNQLQYDLDLRSLGVTRGKVVITPAALVNLDFALNMPWGTRITQRHPAAQQANQPLRWQLMPGELNQIAIVFWLPSPIGIGALVIAVLVCLGTALKQPPASPSLPTRQPSPLE